MILDTYSFAKDTALQASYGPKVVNHLEFDPPVPEGIQPLYMMTRCTYTDTVACPCAMTLFDENKRVINMTETGNITYPIYSDLYETGGVNKEWVMIANLEPGVWTQKEIPIGDRRYKGFSELTPESFSDRYVLVTSRNSAWGESSNKIYSRLGIYAPTTIAYGSFGSSDIYTKLRYYTPRNYGINSIVYCAPMSFNDNRLCIEYMIVCPEAKYMLLNTINGIDRVLYQTVDISDFYDAPRNRYKDVGAAEPEDPDWVVTGQGMVSRKYTARDIISLGKQFAMLFEIRDRHLVPLDVTVPDFLSGVEYPESTI